MDNHKYTYTQVQNLRKTAGYLEDMEKSDNPFWRMSAQIDREKMKPYVDAAYQEGFGRGELKGFNKGMDGGKQIGRGLTRGDIHEGMLIGAPIGAVAGTGVSALLLRKDMSNAKKLAILLAGAGIGGVAGAGVGGTVSGLGLLS